MVIRFSRHMMDKLARELSRVGITEELVEEAVSNPDEVLYDPMTGRYIALRMERSLTVVYERRGEDILIITAIFTSKLEDVVQRRKRSGRWV